VVARAIQRAALSAEPLFSRRASRISPAPTSGRKVTTLRM
jgi:hypothetical protein